MASRNEGVSTLLDSSELLRGLDEYSVLTSNQKAICYTHITCPALTKLEIGRKCHCSVAEVHAFFHSKEWRVLNIELAKQQLQELIQLSVQTLRSCMINGSSAARIEAASKVLISANLLANSYGKIKTDNKMVVLMEPISGNQTSVHPSPETAGSPRLAGALQGSSGRTPIGQDNAGDQ